MKAFLILKILVIVLLSACQITVHSEESWELQNTYILPSENVASSSTVFDKDMYIDFESTFARQPFNESIISLADPNDPNDPNLGTEPELGLVVPLKEGNLALLFCVVIYVLLIVIRFKLNPGKVLDEELTK